MKRNRYVIILWAVLFFIGQACFGQDIDPILLDKPSRFVFDCDNNIFIEVTSKGSITYGIAGRHNPNGKPYLFFEAEVLYLEEGIWDGLAKESFVLKHVDAKGNEKLFPLDYVMTVMMGMKNGWKTISDDFMLGELRLVDLVFEIDKFEPTGWSLLFRPAERGKEMICEVEVPLKVYH